MCQNVWYTFGKILKIKCNGIPGLVQHNIKISEIFTVIWNFYNHLISIFGQKSQNGQCEMNFFSAQVDFDGNLKITYVSKVFIVGIIIFGRRDWTVKQLPKKSLKVKRPLGAVPQAYEFIYVRSTM